MVPVAGGPGSPSTKRHICLEGSDGFVTSTATPIATGWGDPVAGWELHPLETNTFSRRTSVTSLFPPKRFVNTIILMPCQIVRGGRRLIYRLLSWNEWQGMFLRVVHALRC